VTHRADAAPLDVRTTRFELGRQPRFPDVRRLDDVVIDADDLGQVGLYGAPGD
jgi:hypothetical protein